MLDSRHAEEVRLFEKLRRVEALFAGATTEEERASADEARRRLQARLAECAQGDPPIEFRFCLPDVWSRRLLVALARHYGLKPFRYPRQNRRTAMLHVSHRFLTETLWPEYEKLAAKLRQALDEATARVLKDVLHEDELAPLSAPAASSPSKAKARAVGYWTPQLARQGQPDA